MEFIKKSSSNVYLSSAAALTVVTFRHRFFITLTTVFVFSPVSICWLVCQQDYTTTRVQKRQKSKTFTKSRSICQTKQSSYSLNANTNMFVTFLFCTERKGGDKTTWPGVPLLCFCRVVINSEDVVRPKQLGRSAGRHAQIHLSAEKRGDG